MSFNPEIWKLIDDTYITPAQGGTSLLLGKDAYINSGDIVGVNGTGFRFINGQPYFSNTPGTWMPLTDHTALTNLAWASSGHTGTASTLAGFDASGVATLIAQSTYVPETTTTIGALINGATDKTTPVDADYLGLMDSAASNILKKLSWANLKAGIKAYYDSVAATFTNKRIQPRVSSTTSAASVTPDLSSASVYIFTAQAAGFTINAPTGTPIAGETFEIILVTAAAQALTFNAIYKGGGQALPTTTVAGKIMTITCQYIDASNVIVHYSSTV